MTKYTLNDPWQTFEQFNANIQRAPLSQRQKMSWKNKWIYGISTEIMLVFMHEN